MNTPGLEPKRSDSAPAPAPIPSEIQSLLDKAPRPIRRNFQLWSQAVAAVDVAKKKGPVARVRARRLGVAISTIYGRRTEFRKYGALSLVDKRYPAELWEGTRHGIPLPAGHYLTDMAQVNRFTTQAAIRAFTEQLRRWRSGDASARIPGYDSPPSGDPPPGWSPHNPARFLSPRSRRPAAGPALLKITFTLRRQGNAFVWGARQTLPRSPTNQPEPQASTPAPSAAQPNVVTS